MVNLKATIYAAAILLLPVALQARAHRHPHAGLPIASGLAKAAAGAADPAGAITRQDLVGLWSERVTDSSEAFYRSYDTTELYFGDDSGFEMRAKVTEVHLPDGDIVFSSSHARGAWSLAGTNLTMKVQACRTFDSDSSRLWISCFGTQTIPTEGWEIKTSGGRKTWSIPNNDTLDSGRNTDFIYYVSADPSFTLPALLNTAIKPVNRRGDHRVGEGFSFYPGNTLVSRQPLWDLRGKRVAPGRQGQGLYFPAGNPIGR